eukprot:6765852-Pyramimonas_sp.AAC.1
MGIGTRSSCARRLRGLSSCRPCGGDLARRSRRGGGSRRRFWIIESLRSFRQPAMRHRGRLGESCKGRLGI